MENEKLIEEAKATQNATDLVYGLWDNLAEANFRISELEAALAAAMEREKVMREAIATACKTELIEVWDEAADACDPNRKDGDFTDEELIAGFLVAVAALAAKEAP